MPVLSGLLIVAGLLIFVAATFVMARRAQLGCVDEFGLALYPDQPGARISVVPAFGEGSSVSPSIAIGRPQPGHVAVTTLTTDPQPERFHSRRDGFGVTGPVTNTDAESAQAVRPEAGSVWRSQADKGAAGVPPRRDELLAADRDALETTATESLAVELPSREPAVVETDAAERDAQARRRATPEDEVRMVGFRAAEALEADASPAGRRDLASRGAQEPGRPVAEPERSTFSTWAVRADAETAARAPGTTDGPGRAVARELAADRPPHAAASDPKEPPDDRNSRDVNEEDDDKVVVVPGRGRYHRARCWYSGSVVPGIRMAQLDAVADGYEPCQVCHPDQPPGRSILTGQ